MDVTLLIRPIASAMGEPVPRNLQVLSSLSDKELQDIVCHHDKYCAAVIARRGSLPGLGRFLTSFEKNLILDSLHAVGRDSIGFHVDNLRILPRGKNAWEGQFIPETGDIYLTTRNYVGTEAADAYSLEVLVHEAAHAYEFEVEYLSNKATYYSDHALFNAEFSRAFGRRAEWGERPWESSASDVQAVANGLLGGNGIIVPAGEVP